MGALSRRPAASPETTAPATAPDAGQGTGNSWWNDLLGAIGFGSSGTAGAAGREGAVQAQHQAAYDLGFQAEQAPFSGDVYRNVPSRFTATGLDANPGAAGGGRYNASGSPLLYTSPSAAESIGEANAYNGMANRTMITSEYNAPFDATTGRGGVADVVSLAAERNMTGALTPEVGGHGPGWLYNLTGEHPYSMTQQVGAGATDAGASGMRVPSATGGTQLDIIPRNTPQAALNPLEITPYDAHGNAGASAPAGGAVNPMAADTSTARPPGVLEFEPGSTLKPGENAPGRASSVRYGAIGGGAVALGTDLYRLANGEDISAGQVALDTGVGTAAGAGSALAFDALVASGRSAAGAGGIIGGVIEGGMSAYNNISAYNNGEIDGAHAVANTVVDTGVGVGAGMAGAAAGAAIGSIIPGAGTAVGAALGFVGGMAGSYLVHALAEHSGATDFAKEKLAAGLGWAGEGLSNVGSSIADGASGAWNALTGWW